MLKKLKFMFSPAALIFIGASFTGAYFSDSVSISGNTFSTGSSDPSDVVINEFLPNPAGIGTDTDPMPGGEWVELYNKGAWAIDISGWNLYDNIDSHDLSISPSNVGGGSTIIPSHGYMVVYRNGDPQFSLNNSGSDQVRLFTLQIPSGTLIDSVTYSGSTDGKSWARIPDVTGIFTDGHTPTPGGPNV